MRRSILGLLVFSLPLISLTPAEAGLSFYDQGTRLVVFSEAGATIKNVNTKFAFVWYPKAATGADGYLLSFECERYNSDIERTGKGNVIVSKFKLEGMDSGQILAFKKKKGKFKDGETGRVNISRDDLSSLAGESGVLVTGNIKATKKFAGVICNVLLTEFLGGPPV